jgi:2-alkyl-3-oxoalkanoate reductase
VRVFVAGGTGVVGRPLVQALLNDGHEVTASTHRSSSLAGVEMTGAKPVLMDGLDQPAVRRAINEARPDVVVNQMTSLAAPASDFGSWLEVTNRLRVEATATVMSAAHEAGVRRVVAQSASFMTDPSSSVPTDESSALYFEAPEPFRSHVHANASAEMSVLNTDHVDGLVLRYGFFYGTGTAIGPGGDIEAAIRAGEMPVVGAGKGSYPLIHIQDAVAATVRAVTHGGPGIYNIVDDEPATQADWLPFLATLLGAPAPAHVDETEAAARFGTQSVYYGNQLLPASNAKAKADLGVELEFASWRTGFLRVFDPHHD